MSVPRAATDARIGKTFVIPPAPHVGHTVTVEKRDIEKHKAYWLRCQCGAVALIGEGLIDDYLNGKRSPWTPPLGLNEGAYLR